MNNQLTEIKRIRLSPQMTKQLEGLKGFGLNKSKFIRDAILEKMQRDTPKLLAEEKRKLNLIKCPF